MKMAQSSEKFGRCGSMQFRVLGSARWDEINVTSAIRRTRDLLPARKLGRERPRAMSQPEPIALAHATFRDIEAPGPPNLMDGKRQSDRQSQGCV